MAASKKPRRVARRVQISVAALEALVEANDRKKTFIALETRVLELEERFRGLSQLTLHLGATYESLRPRLAEIEHLRKSLRKKLRR